MAVSGVELALWIWSARLGTPRSTSYSRPLPVAAARVREPSPLRHAEPVGQRGGHARPCHSAVKLHQIDVESVAVAREVAGDASS